METPRTVFSLDDLRRWNAPGVSLAVAGHPIAHSLSPRMHNAALRELSGGRPAFRDWRYHAFDIPPSGLAEALGLFHAKGFRGLNITVPHKVAALAAIGDATEGARLAGAVNTLEWLPGGWRGHNTDAHGFSRAVGEEFALSLAGVPVLLLGAGGAARAIAAECLRLRVPSLWVANRTAATRDALLGALAGFAAEQGVPLLPFPGDKPPPDFPTGALVVNATSLGLRPGDPVPIDPGALPRPRAVLDIIYNPPETALLRRAAALGIPSANGLSMLVHQGAGALGIWTGAAVPVAAMRAALA